MAAAKYLATFRDGVKLFIVATDKKDANKTAMIVERDSKRELESLKFVANVGLPLTAEPLAFIEGVEAQEKGINKPDNPFFQNIRMFLDKAEEWNNGWEESNKRKLLTKGE